MLLAHRFLAAVWLAVTFVLPINAQTTKSPLSERPGDSDTALLPYVEESLSRTEHSRVWARIHPDAEGEFARQERYTELAAGLHWNAAEKGSAPIWLPTRVEWELQPDGSALILEAPHTAWLAPDLLSTPFLRSDPADPDRTPLAFAFQGVAYLQTETDEVAWVARPQHAQLEVNGAVAYYRDALDNLSASWVVESRMDGLSAGIVLHELPLPPTSYGFEPDEPVDLIVVSVLVNPDPTMEISSSKLSDPMRTSVADLDEISFDHQQIPLSRTGSQKAHILGRGRAYPVDSGVALGSDFSGQGPEAEVRSGLLWTDSGELLYYEGLPYHELQGPLGQSLVSSKAALDKVPSREGLEQLSLVDSNSSPAADLAQARHNRARALRIKEERFAWNAAQDESAPSNIPGGLFIDYETISSTITTPTTLEAGKTYYISTGLTVASKLTIQGGAVIKMGGAGRFTLAQGGSVVTETTAFRPATIVSKNCNSIGAVIAGSTGTPARGDCQRGFELDYQEQGTLEHLKIAHSWLAVRIYSGHWTIRHSVLRDHYTGLEARGNSVVSVENVLFKNNLNWPIRMYVSATAVPQVSMAHITVDGSPYYAVRYDLVGTDPATSALTVVNSIFQGYGGFYDTRSLSGITLNDRYENCAFEPTSLPPAAMRTMCQSVSDWSTVFDSSTVGNYYLKPTSSLIDAGKRTTQILSILKDRTTKAPASLTSPISSETVIERLPRDAELFADLPDLGYHYQAVDALIDSSGLIVNSDLAVQPGAVISSLGEITVGSNGLLLLSAVPSQRTVLTAAWQLSEGLNGVCPSTGPFFSGLNITGTGGTNSNSVNHVGIYGFHYALECNPDRILGNEIKHSEFQGHSLALYLIHPSNNGEMTVQNCLFLGSEYGVYNPGNTFNAICSTFDACNYPAGGGGKPIAYTNCLFTRFVGFWGSSVHTTLNSAFWDPTYIYPPGTISNCVNCSALPYAAGEQGWHYLNTTPGAGSALTQTGSGTAASHGLYHYTVSPEAGDVREKNNTCSIGYHYPVLGIDTDFDGLLDVDEDFNGDGLAGTGETSWLLADTDGDGFSDSQELDDGTIPWDSTDFPTSAQKANSDHGFDFSNAVGLRVLGGPGDETSGEWEEHTNEFWTHQKKAIINPGLHENGNPYIMNIFMELEVQIPEMLCPEDDFYIHSNY
ncbi:MAG: hypothetical protein ACOX52_12130 [Verrucomicrobiota bacterium]